MDPPPFDCKREHEHEAAYIHRPEIVTFFSTPPKTVVEKWQTVISRNVKTQEDFEGGLDQKRY